MKPAEKIANALASVYRNRAKGATEVTVTVTRLSEMTKLREAKVTEALVKEMNLIWGRLPIGTSLALAQPDSVTVFAR